MYYCECESLRGIGIGAYTGMELFESPARTDRVQEKVFAQSEFPR